MNARQAAKHYKKKYKELKQIISATISQPNITYTRSDIIKLKKISYIPIKKYCKDEFEYNYILTNTKQNLIHTMQDDISKYIQIKKDTDYEECIDKYKETYIAELYILDKN